MKVDIGMDTADSRTLRDHLFGVRHGQQVRENVAFALAEPENQQDKRVRLTIRSIRLMESHEFKSQGPYYVELTDAALSSVIAWAWQERTGLVEIHSHLGNGLAKFSPTDLAGLRESVHYVVWRLPKRPYAALVYENRSVDGLAWLDSSIAPLSIQHVVVGDELIPTTGQSMLAWKSSERGP